MILAPSRRRRIGFAPRSTQTSLTREQLLDRWSSHTAEAGPDLGASAGPPLATLRVRSGLQRGASALPIRGPVAGIGADEANEVVLNGLGIAPRHAQLRLRGGVWSLVDLESPAGSWVDGEAIRGESPLAPGSAVRIGNVVMAFDPEDRWQDSPVEPPAPVRDLFAFHREVTRPVWPTVLFALGAVGIVVALYFLIRNI
jgi:hypothetical protein